jgi:hypothetical protein
LEAAPNSEAAAAGGAHMRQARRRSRSLLILASPILLITSSLPPTGIPVLPVLCNVFTVSLERGTLDPARLQRVAVGREDDTVKDGG